MSSAATRQNLICGKGTPLEAWRACESLACVPDILLTELLPSNRRLVIVAPHPDDEVLMCGGLLSTLDIKEHQVLLVSVTDGEASHPNSERWTPDALRQQRPQESRTALRELGLNPKALKWLRLGLPDTAVCQKETLLSKILAALINRNDIIITTWREDGHCDHEATGRASASAVRSKGATLVEVPIWAWHWAIPDDARIPWRCARKLKLEGDALSRKRRAVYAHDSQTQPDRECPPVLGAHIVERLLQPFELMFIGYGSR